MPCYCDGHAQNYSSLQKMSREVAVVVEVPMFSCWRGKGMRRISKTMNLEGHCPAVEIQDRGRKDGYALARKGVAATRATCEVATEFDP